MHAILIDWRLWMVLWTKKGQHFVADSSITSFTCQQKTEIQTMYIEEQQYNCK